ncbi:3623_t:CDS:2, partial [Dentiscutata heterogama]
SGKDVFKSSIITSLIPDHKFRKICEIILYDFFSMASKNPLNRYIGERKYTVERIVPLFKAIQSVYKEFMFDWIEVQLNCIKDMKTLFPNFDMTLNKADGVCLKVSSNKEVVFIEIAGGPEVTSAVVKHAKEDTEKLIKEAMFGLVSLLRDYLDKNVDKAMKICTYMVQVIGDRITLSELCLNKKHSYMVSQVKSAMLPFSFDEIEKFLEVFELLHALINRLEEQINELKKLMLSNIIEEEPTIRDWIWVPNSITEWEVININDIKT